MMVIGDGLLMVDYILKDFIVVEFFVINIDGVELLVLDGLLCCWEFL